MPDPVHKGLGVAWGAKIDKVEFSASATELKVNHEGQSFAKQASTVDHDDGSGETIGRTVYNQTETLSLRCYPSAQTLAAAKANSVTPKPGDRVIVSWTGDPIHRYGEAEGNWICESVSNERRNNDKMTFDISLWRKADVDITATIA